MAASKFKGQNSGIPKPVGEYFLSSVLLKVEHSIEDYVEGELLHGIVYHSLSSRTKEM